jgi:spore germination protein KC
VKKLLLLLCLLLLTGCWDRLEVSDIGIILAIAIDKDERTGDFLVTSQYIRPGAESTLTPSPDEPSLLVSTTGETLQTAFDKQFNTIDREVFLSHNKVIIINEDLAKEGMLKILDTFQRGKEVRGYVWLCIAANSEAKDMLPSKDNQIARIPANYLDNMLEHVKKRTSPLNLLDFYKKVLEEGIEPMANLLAIETGKTPDERVEFATKAVFQKDKLAGYLTTRELDGYYWLTGERPVSTGLLPLPSHLEDGALVTLEIENLTSDIHTSVDAAGHISFTIDISETGRILEQQASASFATLKEQVDYLKTLEEANKKVIEEEVSAVLTRVQDDFQADIFGIGRELQKEHPHVWNKLKDNWPEIFANATYSINTDVTIRNTYMLDDPLEPK